MAQFYTFGEGGVQPHRKAGWQQTSRAMTMKSGYYWTQVCLSTKMQKLFVVVNAPIVVLASPTILKDGLLLNAIHRDKPNKILIRSLKELEKDVAYATEKGTCVYRVSDTEVAVGGTLNDYIEKFLSLIHLMSRWENNAANRC